MPERSKTFLVGQGCHTTGTSHQKGQGVTFKENGVIRCSLGEDEMWS